jgi:hypothetical protein
MFPQKETVSTVEYMFMDLTNIYSVPLRRRTFQIRAKLFFLIGIVGGGVNWVHSALRRLISLLCQPRVIMIMENLVEWLAGETEVLGENLPQCRFVHHNPHILSGREPGPPRWEASD